MSAKINFTDFVSASKGAALFDPLSVVGEKIVSRSYDVKDFLGLRKKDNRKVWKLFKEALLAEFGSNRVERICKRYNIDIPTLEASAAPLYCNTIEKIRIGVSEVFLSDLGSCSEVKWQSPEQISRKVSSLRRHALADESEQQTRGYSFFFRSFFRDSHVFFDRNKCLLWPKFSRASFRSYLELLTKWMGYLELQEGSLVPAPTVQGAIDSYEVYKKISVQGLVAYALRPISSFSSLKPLLVFRPTVTHVLGQDILYTVLNDFESNLGSMGYKAAKGALAALVADPAFCPRGQKIDAAGYSLGGVHMQRLLADHWRRVDRAFTFNAPSVDSALADNFAAEINAEPADSDEVPSRIEIFRTQGDLAHFVGEKHLGWGITHPKVHRDLLEVDFVEREAEDRFSLVASLARHIHLFLLDRKLFFVAQRLARESIDAQLNNTSVASAERHWEQLRKTLGGFVLFPLVYVANKIFFALHKYFHISLLRYSSPRQEYISSLQRAVAQIYPRENENTSLIR